MTKRDREIVEETIRKHCNIRKWQLHEVNARSNHVHVVVTAPGYAPETVRDQLKAWCTRKLKPHHKDRGKFWTEGASRRYLNTEDELEAAIIYVREAQDRKGVEP
jgi:REP element-mobilizing transposase RayT